jgi:hypothetical protein
MKKILLKRLRELKPIRDKLNKQIDDHKNTIWGFTTIFYMPDDEKCLKAQKELPILQLQLKNILGHIRALEKKNSIRLPSRVSN